MKDDGGGGGREKPVELQVVIIQVIQDRLG
jgi:hypothetical protein